MTTVYSSQIDLALSLLTEKGRDVLIKKYTGGVVNSAAQSFEEPAPQRFETKGVVLPAAKGTISGFDNKSQNMTATYQRFWIVAAKNAPFEPEEGDKMEFDGYEWNVAGCTPVAPDGTAIIYRIGCYR